MDLAVYDLNGRRIATLARETYAAGRHREGLQWCDDLFALERDAQIAAWINLYNAVTVDLILDHEPVESIKALDDPDAGVPAPPDLIAPCYEVLADGCCGPVVEIDWCTGVCPSRSDWSLSAVRRSAHQPWIHGMLTFRRTFVWLTVMVRRRPRSPVHLQNWHRGNQ